MLLTLMAFVSWVHFAIAVSVAFLAPCLLDELMMTPACYMCPHFRPLVRHMYTH